MTLFYFSVCLQILLFFYFEVITLIDLYPWNDISKYKRKEKWVEAIANGMILLLIFALFLTKTKLLMTIAIVCLLFFFSIQLLVWWLPYMTGIHLKQFPKSLYDSHFRETIKILPPIKDNIVPDAQHNVLQAMTFVTLFISTLSLLQL